MKSKSVITIVLLLLAVGLLVGSFFLAQSLLNNQGPKDASASGCNTCFSSGNCSSASDWERGWYNGCTEKKSDGSITRNNKADVDNDGVVQAGDQGRSGKTAGSNVNNPSAPAKPVVGVVNGQYFVTYPGNPNPVPVGSKEAAEAAVKTTYANTVQTLTGVSTVQPVNGVCPTGNLTCRNNAGKQFCIPNDGKTTCNQYTRAVEGYVLYDFASTTTCIGQGEDLLPNTICCGGLVSDGGKCGCPGGESRTLSADRGTIKAGSCYDKNAGGVQYIEGKSNAPQYWCTPSGGRPGEGAYKNAGACCPGLTEEDGVCTGTTRAGGTLHTCSNFTSLSQFQQAAREGCQTQTALNGSGVSFTGTCNKANLQKQASKMCGVVQCDMNDGSFMSIMATGGCNFATASVQAADFQYAGVAPTASIPPTGGDDGTNGGTTTPPPVTVQCNYLNFVSPTPSTNFPPGQDFVFEAQYDCNSLNNNLSLTVLDSNDNPVGSPTIADQESQNYNAANDTCTYTFHWSADGLADGTYDVRLLLNGTQASVVESPAACTQDLTILTGAPEQPAFSIIKTSSHVCSDTGTTLNYTITVRNIGAVAAPLDFVEDDLPAGIDGTDTAQVTNINPAPTTRTTNALRWNVNATLQPNQTRTFTYSIVLTAAEVAAYGTDDNLLNVVVAQYGDNDSTVQFENSVSLNCLPDTGLFDENPAIILGLMLILVGIVINRSGLVLRFFGKEASGFDATAGIVRQLSGIEGSYEDKVLRDAEAKDKSNIN